MIGEPPKRLLQWGFSWTSRVLTKIKFHDYSIDPQSPTAVDDPIWKDPRPIFFYSTHESFWDPIVAADVAVLRCGRSCVAPMAQKQFESFRSLRGVGIFGVNSGDHDAVDDFIGKHIAVSRFPAVWVTPQGAFVKNSFEQPRFKLGLSFWTLKRDCIRVPVSIRYTGESRPDVKVRIGKTEIIVANRDLDFQRDKEKIIADAECLRYKLEACARDC